MRIDQFQLTHHNLMGHAKCVFEIFDKYLLQNIKCVFEMSFFSLQNTINSPIISKKHFPYEFQNVGFVFFTN